MKRILTLMLALLLCLSLTAPALADVIYEPGDAFYQSHREECTYENRSYIAPASGADICTKPGGSKIGSYAAGETIYSDYLYTDPKTGDVWGSAWFRDGNNWKDGWVCLNGMQLVYDYRDFEAEYGAGIYSPKEGEDMPSLCLCDSVIVFWAYPGAEQPANIADYWLDTEADEAKRADQTLSFSKLYKDAAGNQWGFLGYWQGRRNQWINLSDPDAETCPVLDVTPKYVEKGAAADVMSPQTGDDGNTLLWLAVALVAAVVVVTGFLLARRKRGKKAQ